LSSNEPDGPLYAIGDVHGCAVELQTLLDGLPLTPESTVVFLGDYVDRGPHANQVIDTVMALRERCQVIALRGNHEQMFLDFLAEQDPRLMARFIYNGGSATLSSYADEEGIWHIPAEHVEFLQNMPLVWETPDYFFVHAGVPNIPLSRLDLERHAPYLLWARKGFLDSNFRWEKTIVHGHTVVNGAEQTARRVNLDTGCVFDGHLSAMELRTRTLYTVDRMAPSEPIQLRAASDRRAAVRFKGDLPVTTLRNGVTHRFEALDYNEIGLHLKHLDGMDDLLYRPGASIVGTIDPDGDAPVTFEGVVVRATRVDTLWHYGIQLTERSVATPVLPPESEL